MFGKEDSSTRQIGDWWILIHQHSHSHHSGNLSRSPISTASTSSGLIFTTSFVRRSRNSTTPSFKPFAPTVSRSGMPSRSASLNLTPGLSPSRSSWSTSNPARFEIRLDLIGDRGDLRLRRIEADQMHVIRRNRPRPDDAVGVVVLFDHRGNRPRDADAVAAHHHRTLRARLVEVHAVHRH